MALSVPSSGNGNGLAGLLRHARPGKAEPAGGTAPSDQTAAVSVRPTGRSGIDSTQRGTAQISAALTVYLSRLGGSDEPEPASAAPKAKDGTMRDGGPAASARSDAADLLRTLDSYRGQASGLRLTA